MDENTKSELLPEEETPEADALPEEADTEEPAEDDGPAVDMVFGMRRRTFHLVVVGYALGVIVIGLLGLAGLYPEDGGTVIPGVIGAALGYALAAYLDRKDEASGADGNGGPKS